MMAPTRIEAKPKSGQVGVVHLGLGAFHRAHQAVYLERYRQRSGDVTWGVSSANLRTSIGLVEGCAQQDIAIMWRSTLAARVSRCVKLV